MAKKGIIGETVRAAVTTAQKAIAPTPLAKRMIAAAASQAVGMAEARAREALPSVEKAIKQVVQERVLRPVDSLFGTGEAEPAARKPARRKATGRPARGKTVARKSASRKKATKKSTPSRTTRARKQPTRKPARKTARAKAKRR